MAVSAGDSAEPRTTDTVVGIIIISASLLFVGLLLGSPFLGKRLPNSSTDYVFRATIGALSFWYVVRQNQDLLRQVWDHPWGKLFYGLVASVTVTVGKVWADQDIRLLTQSNPSLFSSAQQLITVFNIVVIILLGIMAVMMVPFTLQCVKIIFVEILYWVNIFGDIFGDIFGIKLVKVNRSSTPTLREVASLLAYVWGSVFIVIVGGFLNTGLAEGVGKQYNSVEELLLWSSFIPNDLGLAGSDRVCVNLPPSTLVSPFSTRDPIPNQVVEALPLGIGPDKLIGSYTYHVVACSKPPGPGG
jgi:hypothetical protein